MKNLIFVIGVGLVSLAVFWLPFWFRTGQFWGIEFGYRGMETIVQNFDGLNFLVVAKSLYNPAIIDKINQGFSTGNDPIYFAAHFPLFPLILRGFEFLMPTAYALLATIILGNILLAVGLYLFFREMTHNSHKALWLTIFGLFLPARILSVRGVGSNEPLFIFFVLISLTLAARGKHWWAGIVGSLAVLTRSPGILLFAGYVLAAVASYRLNVKKIFLAILPYLTMPLTLAGIFVFYAWQYQDPLAYFHSGDNLHLFFPPFQIFSNMASWVSGMWREDLVYIYLFYAAGLAVYLKSLKGKMGIEKLAPGAFGLLYGIVLLFVTHRDLARYSLPLTPIVMLGLAKIADHQELKWLWILLLIPVYLLGWQFILANIQPIADWTALL